MSFKIFAIKNVIINQNHTVLQDDAECFISIQMQPFER